MKKTISFGILLLAITMVTVRAAGPASDNAAQPAYSDGWSVGDNGGTGFGAWNILTQNFIGNSTSNGAGGTSLGINTAGVAFGLFSNTGAPGFAQAVRPFSSSLQIGEIFMLDFDNGTVGNLNQVGFSLRNASSNTLFAFTFTGGTNSYSVESATTQGTAHGFTADGMTASFTLTSATTFSFSIQFHDNLSTETFTGTLANPGGAITEFRVFSQNGNDSNSPSSSSDVYFNNIAIVVPEPSSLALLAGPGILGAWFFVRRRRS